MDIQEYEPTITVAQQLQGVYEKPVIFHCYWNGIISLKHFYSIMSCYLFNVVDKPHRIILWVENNRPNRLSEILSRYVEIRQFSLKEEISGTFLESQPLKYNKALSYYSDVVRYVLLYKYGGCWVDLDCLILRSFDPLFCTYEKEICVYTWENQSHPNGAIYISLEPKSEKMKKNIEFIIQRGQGWGFQEADLTFNLPLDMLVLPCSWFDAGWIKNPQDISFTKFMEASDIKYTLEDFLPGSFCFHWHNNWLKMPHPTSPFTQLTSIIKERLSL